MESGYHYGNGTHVTASWGNSPGLRTGLSGTLTATVSNFLPKLNWAKSFNFARVLHNSSLLMENKTPGTISTNTTVPSIDLGEGKGVQGGGSTAK